MDAPPGFVQKFGGRVCKLRKSIYRLKQSPRAWFDKFAKFVKSLGYSQGHSDHTLFTKIFEGKVSCLIVYVNDIIVTGNDFKEMEKMKVNLTKEFEIKDLGYLKYFLGMAMARSRK